MNYTVLTEIRWKADRFEAVKRTLYTQLTAILNAPEVSRGALLANLVPIVTAYLGDFSKSQTKSSILQLHRFEVLAADIEKAVAAVDQTTASDAVDQKIWNHLVAILENLAFETDITDITLASTLLENRLLIEFLDTVADDWSHLDLNGRRATVREIEKGLDALDENAEPARPGEAAVRLRRAVERMIHTYRSLCSDEVKCHGDDGSALEELRRLRQDSHKREILTIRDILTTMGGEEGVYLKMTLEVGRLLLEDEIDRPEGGLAGDKIDRAASRRLIDAIRVMTKRH